MDWNKAKVLSINEIRFLLPKNFTGSLADGLRVLANYLDEDLGRGSKPELFDKEEYKTNSWDVFTHEVERGFKVIGFADIYNWNSEKKKWETLDRKIVE